MGQENKIPLVRILWYFKSFLQFQKLFFSCFIWKPVVSTFSSKDSRPDTCKTVCFNQSFGNTHFWNLQTQTLRRRLMSCQENSNRGTQEMKKEKKGWEFIVSIVLVSKAIFHYAFQFLQIAEFGRKLLSLDIFFWQNLLEICHRLLLKDFCLILVIFRCN